MTILMRRTVCAMRSLVLATNLRICREWGICARTWLQELAPIGLVKAVEGRDVRVVQRGEKVGLMLEPRVWGQVADAVGVDDLVVGQFRGH